jgi:predicted small secreted protein
MTGFSLFRPLLALVLMLGLAACETAEGFVEDSENLGEAIADEV